MPLQPSKFSELTAVKVVKRDMERLEIFCEVEALEVHRRCGVAYVRISVVLSSAPLGAEFNLFRPKKLQG